MKNRKKYIVIAAIVAMSVMAMTGCGSGRAKNLVFCLDFDEGSGQVVRDSTGTLNDAKINYTLSNATYMESQDPQWRENGVEGGCLLFDGGTTISYRANEIAIGGDALTVSCWVAPRTFEWDDPNAADSGNDSLTGIVGQPDKGGKKGFILGYQRFGRLSFQVGTGAEWLSVWSDEGVNLEKYAWNMVTAVFDGKAGNMALYLNGEQVASEEIPKGTSIAESNRQFVVGRNAEGQQMAAGNVNSLSGYLDELKIYSGTKKAKDIAAEYAAAEVPEIEFEDIWLQNILTEDYTRPQYHAAPYQFWMNEPHAPVYYNGMYHLFFQENMSGSYWRNICWGHLVSEDMVNWRPVKEAIVPTEGSVVPDGVWTGGAALDVNGVPLLFFTAGNDNYAKYDGLISNQNIGVAYSADLTDKELTDWIIYDELAVIQQKGQGRAGEFRDPHIWKEGDTWCMLICSGSATTNGGTALLYTTKTLELKSDGTLDMDWQYVGPVYEMKDQPVTYGTSWELPIILPLTNKAGTITKYFFEFSPAPAGIADNKVYYFLGDFDLKSGKFTPEARFNGVPELLDYGCNVFTGPSVLTDPVSGNTYMFSIMQDQRSAAEEGASGWAHTAGIARRIWLSDDGEDVMIAPIDTLASLEEKTLADEKNLTLENANKILENIRGDMLHIKLTANVENADTFGIDLKKGGKWDCTTYSYDVAAETIAGRTENKGDGASTKVVSGTLPLADGRITMDIYIDRSLVEGFFNEYKAISIRAYVEDAASQNIDLFAEGDVVIESLHVATMGSIFD